MGSQTSTQQASIIKYQIDSKGNTPVSLKRDQSLSPPRNEMKKQVSAQQIPLSKEVILPVIKEKAKTNTEITFCYKTEQENNFNIEQSTVLQNIQCQSSQSSLDSNVQINENVMVDVNSSRNKLQTAQFDQPADHEPIVIAICDEYVESIHHPSEEEAKPLEQAEIIVSNPKIAGAWKRLGPYRVVNSNQKPFLYHDGQIYVGGWLTQQRNGYGILLTQDYLYEGYFLKDQFHGDGRIIYSNSEVYIGEFQNGVFQGDGKFTSSEQIIYEGEWYEGKRNGMGKEQLPDGSVFIGTFENNLRHGQGKLYNNKDSSVFEGEWVEGKALQKGILIWQDGRKYEGEWNNGMMHGWGMSFWPGGKKYIGNYVNNVRDGYGEYYYADGKIYKGMWKGGLMHGQGILIYPNESHEKGVWKSGRKVTQKEKKGIQEKKVILPL